MKVVWWLLNIIQFTLVILSTIISTVLVFLILPFVKKPMLMGIVGVYVWSPTLLAALMVRLKVIGKENIPLQPAIYVANHESLVDIPVVIKATGLPLFFVAKKELKKVPFLGWSMMAAGTIFIDRGNREKAMANMKRAGELVKKGRNVISFPEGTRSKSGELGIFKRGSFIIASSANVPIIPIAIKGTRQALPSGSFSTRPGLVKVKIGTPISTEGIDLKNIDALANEVRGRINDMLNELG